MYYGISNCVCITLVKMYYELSSNYKGSYVSMHCVVILFVHIADIVPCVKKCQCVYICYIKLYFAKF